MFRLILRSALLIASGTLLSAAIGIELHRTRRTENFFVHDLREVRNSTSIADGGENERIELGLDVLAVSAERVRRAVFRFLGVPSFGASSVHLILKERSKVRSEIQIVPLFHWNAWQYRVEVAESVMRENLLRGLIEVVLVEFANRGNGPKSAEIPRWLKEGLTFQLMNSVGPELVISSVEQGSMLRSIRRLLGADPARETHAILRPGNNPSVSDLSYPSSEQLEGENFKKYQAAAQLFLLELLRLPAGDEYLVRMIRNLPNFWNWESSFLRGFSAHFQSMLDVEKWWAVTMVSFTGRDPTQVWSPAICLQQLDEILLPTTHLRWSTNALPIRGHATLQQVLSEWDFRPQREVLWQTVRRLTALRTYCPSVILPLVDAYRSSLLRYMEKRASLITAPSNKLYSAPSTQQIVGATVNELDELYRWREALRREYAPGPLAGVID